MRSSTRYIVLGSLLAIVLGSGCGGRDRTASTDPVWYDDLLGPGGQPPSGWPDAAACSPLGGQAGRGGDLVVALGQAVAPDHAPVPTNDAERVAFAGLYETLTTVTCTGVLAPGLAVSWQPHEDGRRWRLHLREDAVFWDGTPVTTREVIDAWARNLTATRHRALPCPGLWLEAEGRGIIARGPYDLEIRLAEPQRDLPRLLAHPALAVAALRDGWVWPVGSGPCRLAADSDLPLPDLVLRPNHHHPSPPTWRSLAVRVLAGADPRDLLGAGVDLAVVRDRRALDYYAEVPDVRRTALPWDRKYVLVTSPELSLPGVGGATLAAAEVTLADGRPTDHLTFRRCDPDVGCPQLHGPTVSVFSPPFDRDPALAALTRNRLYHLAGDPDAAALAARVAAGLLPGLRTTAVGAVNLARALQDDEGGAYIVRLDACYPAPCLTLAALLAHAHWLQATLPTELDDPCEATRLLRTSGRALPLVDTRAHLVWRGPLAGLALAHDGTPLLGTLSVAAGEATP